MLSGNQRKARKVSFFKTTEIDPAVLNPESKALLKALLKNNESVPVLPAAEYNVPVAGSKNCLGRVRMKNCRVKLMKTLAQYPSQHEPDVKHWAVCPAKPVASGNEGEVYFADASIKLANGDVSYKSKTKIRTVKHHKDCSHAAGANCGCDQRSAEIRAAREQMFLSIIAPKSKSVKAPLYKNGHAVLMFPYIDGITLRHYLDESLSDAQRLAVGILIGEAITALHAKDIIHRDIKPENILVKVDASNNPIAVKLIDLSHSNRKGDKVNTVGGGTPGYSAPEIETTRGDEKADAYSYAKVLQDIWSEAFNSNLSSEQRTKIEYDMYVGGVEANSENRADVLSMIETQQAIRDELKAVKSLRV